MRGSPSAMRWRACASKHARSGRLPRLGRRLLACSAGRPIGRLSTIFCLKRALLLTCAGARARPRSRRRSNSPARAKSNSARREPSRRSGSAPRRSIQAKNAQHDFRSIPRLWARRRHRRRRNTQFASLRGVLHPEGCNPVRSITIQERRPMGRMTGADNVAQLFPSAAPGVSPEDVRIAEALVFAAAEPLEESVIAQRLSERADVGAVMEELQRIYEGRGVNLVQVARRWMFRTAEDLAWALARDRDEKRKLSRAALETLAIVAYHQPVTRADIEQIRGVAVSKGALDVLMEARWVRMRGRRKAPGRPITYGTTNDFLVEFGLGAIADLPGLDELKGAGLFEGNLPAGYDVPQPDDASALRADEEPLEDSPLEQAWAPVAPEEG